MLAWTRSASGVLSAAEGECSFEIAATETGFVLVAEGAGTLSVQTESEAAAQHTATLLLRCWPRWNITPDPVIDS